MDIFDFLFDHSGIQNILDFPDQFPFTELDGTQLWEIAHDSEIPLDTIGDPAGEMEYLIHQSEDYSCAVAAQKEVLESITGIDIPESELIDVAYSHGWFDPATGTLPQNVGKVLELYGVPTQQYEHFSLNNIAEALANGDKVIVAVDADEIWHPKFNVDGQIIEQMNAGHAVWVTGLSQDVNGMWNVIMNDSGTGKTLMVPANVFEQSWQDFNNFAVVAHTNTN